MRARNLVAASTPASLLALCVLLPFFHKAFTIDDTSFLEQAQHLLRDPLHPTAFDMVFDGTRIRWSAAGVSGPVMAFLLLPTVLHGGAEWVAHLTQLAMLLLGIVATAGLALRLELNRWQAGVAALLVASAPPVLAMASTSMPDVPAMTLAVLSIERLLAWRASGRPATAVATALTLALAALARPHLLLLIGIAPLFLGSPPPGALGLRPTSWLLRATLPLSLAVLLLTGFNFVTRDPVAGHHLAKTVLLRMQLWRVPFNLVSFLNQWTLMFPLAIPWAVLHRRRFFRLRRTHWAMALTGVLTLITGLVSGRPWLVLFAPLSSLGSATLVDILAAAWQRGDRRQLGLGLWLLLALPTALYEHLPAKYLVASAPAMAILLACALGRSALSEVGARYEQSPWPRGASLLTGACALIGVVLAVLILRADAALAEVGRRGGKVVAAAMAASGRSTVWMDGGWGFQWYAMQAGARPMTDQPPLPAPGDLVVVSLRGGRIEQCPRRTLLYSERFGGWGGRVLGEGAGFYSNGYGQLPWSWGNEELGRIEVWRIEGPPPGPGPGSLAPAP